MIENYAYINIKPHYISTFIVTCILETTLDLLMCNTVNL